MTTPDRQGTSSWAWLTAGGWTLLIYLTIPLARPIQEWVQTHGGQQLFLWTTFTAIGLTALGTASAVARRRLTLRPTAATALVAIGLVFVALTWSLRENPEESIHCIQYGVLSWLLLRALRLRHQGWTAHFAAAMIGVTLGIVDELIQWLIPWRYFDFRDLGINALAVLLAQAGLILTAPTGTFSFSRPVCPDWSGVRTGLLATAAGLGLLLFCCANTPALLAWYGRVLPALAFIDEVTAEYGHRHDNHRGLVFVSRLDRQELARQDRERAVEVGRALSRHREEADYARFLRTHPPHLDPLLVEARVRLFRRDRHAQLVALTKNDDGLRRRHARIAVAENLIMMEFLPTVLRHSGFAWPEPIRLRLEILAGPITSYRSPVSGSLIIAISRPVLLSTLTTLLALTLIATAWSRRLAQDSRPGRLTVPPGGETRPPGQKGRAG